MLSRSKRTNSTCKAALFSGLLLVGCTTKQEWDEFFKVNQDKGGQPTAAARPVSEDPSIRDTVAPLVTIEGMRLNQVRGFGLVIGLVDTGGSDGPEVVKDYLFKEIQRQQDPSRPGPMPSQFLSGRDACMVEITGFIPAGAQRGDRFDVAVRALGSEATSLVGGRLYLGELKVWAETPSGVLSGMTLATASGPVFVSPFKRDGKPSDRVELTTGLVLGGGVVKEDRKIRLVLNDPSPSMAKRIERELNSRFGGLNKVAKGERASHVALEIPRDFLDRKWHFLNRVLHTPLVSNETFILKRTKDLIQAYESADPDYESISIALEAIGKDVLPQMERLYGSESPAISFYAARTALRLGDRKGLDVISRHAHDRNSSFRDQAIAELGWARNFYTAGEDLVKLLDDPDKEIRIRAYQALLKRPHPAIETKVLGLDRVILDIVETKGPFMIYARRSIQPRIAVFGRSMAVTPPLIFPGDRIDGRVLTVQLSAEAGDKTMTYIYRNRENKRISPVLQAPLNVGELVAYLCDTPRRQDDGSVRGFGVGYSEMLDVLSNFCEMKSLAAEFVLEGLESKDASESNERDESEY